MRLVGAVALSAAMTLGIAACGEAAEPPPEQSRAGVPTIRQVDPAQTPPLSAADKPQALATARERCTRFVSLYGSDDDGDGTLARPWRTVRELVLHLEPGDVACLRQGNYSGNVTLRRGGQPSLPVTIRSYPGESARIIGRIWVTSTADRVVFREIYLDGRNATSLPSPTVNSDFVSFIRVDVTNAHTGICFSLGNIRYGFARWALISNSRIHDCGRLPATNHDHGIYLARSRSSRILNNWIHDNADRGVQLYPDAQATTIRGNVIARNGQGVIFSGDETVASNDNVVESNVIVESLIRHNVESHYPDGAPLGNGNVVRTNCVWGGPRDTGTGGIEDPAIGFLPEDNVRATPSFIDPLRDDFRLRESTCAEQLAAPPNAVPGPTRAGPRLPP
jgi:parallel beta-helix repeat protein